MTSVIPFDPLPELAEIYAAADALYAAWSCPGSADCCRFAVTGREPFVTSVELFALERAAKRVGRPVRSKRALPLVRDEAGSCPMLSPNARCVIYADRPLGCRTFYCDLATPGGRVRHREVQELVRRLEALSQRWDGAYGKGTPLTRALAAGTKR